MGTPASSGSRAVAAPLMESGLWLGDVVSRFDIRAENAGLLGLQVPYLRGDEDGALHNLHPANDLVRFKLPGEVPRPDELASMPLRVEW